MIKNVLTIEVTYSTDTQEYYAMIPFPDTEGTGWDALAVESDGETPASAVDRAMDRWVRWTEARDHRNLRKAFGKEGV